MLKCSEKGYRFVGYDFFQNLVTWYPPLRENTRFLYFFQIFRVFLYLLGLQMHFAGQTLWSFVNFNPYILIRSKFTYILVKIVSKHTFLYVFMRFLPFFYIFLYFFNLKFHDIRFNVFKFYFWKTSIFSIFKGYPYHCTVGD